MLDNLSRQIRLFRSKSDYTIVERYYHMQLRTSHKTILLKGSENLIICVYHFMLLSKLWCTLHKIPIWFLSYLMFLSLTL